MILVKVILTFTPDICRAPQIYHGQKCYECNAEQFLDATTANPKCITIQNCNQLEGNFNNSVIMFPDRICTCANDYVQSDIGCIKIPKLNE